MRLIKVFLALALLFAALPAHATTTILFAGGEDTDLTLTGSVAVDTTSAHFRSGYAREDLNIATQTVADPPANRITTPAVANQTIMWVHAVSYNGGSLISSNAQMMGLFGSDGVRRLLVRATGTANQVKISTRNTAATITDLVTCTSGAWTSLSTIKVDWFTNYAVSGETTLYINGVQVCDFVGDVTTNSVTAVNQADFASPSNVTPIGWSEIILATGDTRSMNLFTASPVANGSNMTWSGSCTNINPTTINDASVISTGSSGNIAECTAPSLPSGSFTVPAVTQTARFQAGASGPQSFYYIARPSSGSTDYNNGSAQTGTTSFANYQHVWSQNPACSCGWGTGDLGTGVNFGVESQP
jgi:hypothetical protein